jgi:hypothetical protein
MSDWGGSEEDGSEEEGGNDDGPDLLSQLFDAGDKNDERGAPAAYEQDFKELEDDILGDHVDDSDDDDFSKPKHGGRGGGKGRGRGGGRGGRRQEEEEEEDKPFMLFDFQGGADEWPDNVTLVDSQKAEELIDAAKKTIEKKSMEKKKEDGKSKKEGTDPPRTACSCCTAARTIATCSDQMPKDCANGAQTQKQCRMAPPCQAVARAFGTTISATWKL